MVFQKNSTGIWSFLHYQEIWYFFFRKYMIIFLRRKRKNDLSQKKTKKMEIWCFLQMFEKTVFQKKLLWNMIFNISKDRTSFFPENVIISLWTENERWFFSKNMLFSVYMHKCYKYHITLLPKKTQR